MDTSETEFGDAGRINFRDFPVFYVVTNFVVSNITALNAPIRQIPMTHKSHQPIPLLGEFKLRYAGFTVEKCIGFIIIVRERVREGNVSVMSICLSI